MTNLTTEQVGAAQADNVYLPVYRAQMISRRNDEVRTLGQGSGWMHGHLVALARDASNRIRTVVRQTGRSVWDLMTASSPNERRSSCIGPHRDARFNVVKTRSIPCIVRSLGVIQV